MIFFIRQISFHGIEIYLYGNIFLIPVCSKINRKRFRKGPQLPNDIHIIEVDWLAVNNNPIEMVNFIHSRQMESRKAEKGALNGLDSEDISENKSVAEKCGRKD